MKLRQPEDDRVFLLEESVIDTLRHMSSRLLHSKDDRVCLEGKILDDIISLRLIAISPKVFSENQKLTSEVRELRRRLGDLS